MNNKSKQKNPHADIKVQPPLLVLIHVVLTFVLARLIPLPLSVPPVLQTLGLLLAMFGFLLGVAALIAFRGARSKSNTHNSVARLVTSGVYGFTRNPVYLGFVLILIGLSLSIGSYWGVFLAPILIILFNRLVVEPEENYLAQKFGKEFEDYKTKVRRWI